MEVLFSKTGSSGNANIVTDGKTLIQIDAGIQSRKVNSGCGYRLPEVDGLIVSHCHGD